MLDVIAIHLDGTNSCLDFCGTTPMDQVFRHCDPNLCHLKATAVKGVEHLTMVIVLDEDHTDYSDAFGNIFKEDS